MKNLIVFPVAVVISFLLFLLLGAKRTGEKPIVGFSIILYEGNNVCLHIHHWMYMFVIALLVAIVIFLSNGQVTAPILALYGFLLGGSLASLRYKDSLHVRVPCSSKD